MDLSAYPPNYSEADIPAYRLPDLGPPAEMRRALADYVYGHLRIDPPRMELELVESAIDAIGGIAERRQYRVRLKNKMGESAFDLLLYLPVSRSGTVPVFLGLNFFGNHTVDPDAAIRLPQSWVPKDTGGSSADQSTRHERGIQASRWAIADILKAGFGLATVFSGDFAPDDPQHFHEGVLRLLPPPSVEEAATRGGAIAAWAWGLSRALDALGEIPGVDAARVAVCGHSRLGKAALWAGACDDRFSIVISNNSGCAGAALFRRKIGERIVHITSYFPFWFSPLFLQYRERDAELPVDQHQLLALIAPRALYVASAVDDKWADPKGEYLALAAAAPAWGETMRAESPDADAPFLGQRLGYHIRSGLHDITPYDWAQFLNFARSVWKL